MMRLWELQLIIAIKISLNPKPYIILYSYDTERLGGIRLKGFGALDMGNTVALRIRCMLTIGRSRVALGVTDRVRGCTGGKGAHHVQNKK